MSNSAATFEARVRKARPLSAFREGGTVHALGTYSYTLAHPPGEAFEAGFTPDLSPAAMLAAGVFEGAYLNDATGEFPREWFALAHAAGRLAVAAHRDATRFNAFGVKARMPLSAWRAAGWVPGGRGPPPARHALLADPQRNPDERGWFQWYARYWLGRRLPELDAVQIKRWRSFKARHKGALAKASGAAPKQRQALLQWAIA